jgi:hypothetical protein
MKIRLVSILVTFFIRESKAQEISLITAINPSINFNSLTNGRNSGNSVGFNTYSDRSFNVMPTLDYTIGVSIKRKTYELVANYAFVTLVQKLSTPNFSQQISIATRQNHHGCNIQFGQRVASSKSLKLYNRIGVQALFGTFNKKLKVYSTYPSTTTYYIDYLRNFNTLSGVNFLLHNTIAVSRNISNKVNIELGFESFFGLKSIFTDMAVFRIVDENGLTSYVGNATGINKADKLGVSFSFQYRIR